MNLFKFVPDGNILEVERNYTKNNLLKYLSVPISKYNII